MSDYILAFDVGGTFIKSAALLASGELVPESVASYPAKASLGREELLGHLTELIWRQMGTILTGDPLARLHGIGYAFPGEFDYPNGISYIAGLGKFESLYGVNLKQEVTARVLADAAGLGKRLSPRFRIAFENDASLFALGEWKLGKARPYRRSVCLTIGTGAGSAFLDGGRLVSSGAEVPPRGWICFLPFGDGIVDQYVSERGFLKLAADLAGPAGAAEGFGIKGLGVREFGVKEFAAMAREGNEAARRAFDQFGRNIGEVINRHLSAFRPEAIILGGQISKSSDLFLGGILDVLHDKAMAIETTDDTSLSTFAGAAELLRLE
ncbi:ROK family protein [Cohnella fermenti]|uniref:ROK family protein n=1 Tax=Cohnella fermenti TaxID=2565925 RepID=A0A4S4BFF8_9BACL|nr:ROK family protein [Cohnella fermenti]THF72912.1 ROK family protein [Cohnella fermenti]